MARIVVVSAGYLGDVAPFVPPANRLARRGHDVTFLTPAGFHSMLGDERFSLATYPLDFSPSAMHADERHERLMRHPFANTMRLARYWVGRAVTNDPDSVRTTMLANLDGADAVVGHPTMASVVAPVAEHLGVPLVVGQLFPMLIPTAAWTPPVGRRSLRLGRPLNRAAWSVAETLVKYGLDDRTQNQYRAAVGQPPLRANGLTAWKSAAAAVVLVSRHYFGEEPDDWPPLSWGGFSVWDGPAGYEADPTIDAFVDAGDPPVLVTLGTSAATNAGAQFAAIGSALDEQGVRSLMLVGYEGNLGPLAGRTGVFVFAPMTGVLPRCRIAVISGALGSLAAALTAGVPVVVVPQLPDQLWHGRRVEELGVGVMARRVRDVPRAVARLEADPTFAERARSLAATMAGEDGATALADAVEQVVAPGTAQ